MTTREALIEARAQARQARRRRTLISAGVFVGAPTLATALYLLLIAPAAYVSTAAFTIRGAGGGGGAGLLGAVGISVPTEASRDTGVVADFIRSPAMVDALRKQGLLEKAYARFSLDPVSRLPPKASLEHATDFWRRKVKVATTNGGGTSMSIEAYTPEDSLALARAVLATSEEVVNSLSRGPAGTIEKVGAQEVERTRAQFEAAKARLVDFQARHPSVPLQAPQVDAARIAGGAEEQLAQARVELAAALQTYQPDAPQVSVLRRKVAALEAERSRALGRALGATGAPAASNEVQGRTLLLEYEFASKAYYGAMQALEQARRQSRTDEKYVVSYVPPQKPERSNYWSRLSNVLAVAIAASVLWGLGALSLSVIKDHMR